MRRQVAFYGPQRKERRTHLVPVLFLSDEDYSH